MKGLMRMLMMFGPMIYRQFQKYQRNKSKQNPQQNPDGQIDRGQEPDKKH